MTNTPMQVDTPSQATEEEPKAESIQMNKLKMAFDIALSSSLSSASYLPFANSNTHAHHDAIYDDDPAII